jgi:hypothetical protein
VTARRAGVRRRSFDPAGFLVSDGYSYSLLTAERLLPSRSAAAAAWQRCRPATWGLWAAHAATLAGAYPFPPAGARAHDGVLGLDDATLDEAVAALESFRERVRDPALLDALDLFEDHLRWGSTRSSGLAG